MSIIKNFAWQSLGIYSASVVSLFLLPYLTRTLKAESFGELAIAQSLAAILALLMDFGFLYVGPPEVMQARGYGARKVGEVLRSALVAKLGIQIFIAAFTILWILHEWPSIDSRLVWAAILWSFSYAIQPSWVAWGLEDHHIYALIEALPKLVSLFAILYFIRSGDQAFLVLLFQAVFMLLTSTMIWFFYLRKYPARFVDYKIAFSLIKKGLLMMVYRFLGNAYLNFATYLLGLAKGALYAGVYGASDKAARALLLFSEPGLRILIPLTTRKLITQNVTYSHILKVGLLLGIGTTLISLIMSLVAHPLLQLLLGEEFIKTSPDVVVVFRILTFLLPLHSLTKYLYVALITPLGASCSTLASTGQAIGFGTLFLFSLMYWSRLEPTLMAYFVLASQFFVLVAAIFTARSCIERVLKK